MKELATSARHAAGAAHRIAPTGVAVKTLATSPRLSTGALLLDVTRGLR